jgi:hypothetical protein
MVDDQRFPTALKFVMATVVLIALLSPIEIANQVFVMREFSRIPGALDANWTNFAVPIALISLQSTFAIVTVVLLLLKRTSFFRYKISLAFLLAVFSVAAVRWALHIAPYGSSLSSTAAFSLAMFDAMTHWLSKGSSFHQLGGFRTSMVEVAWVLWFLGLSTVVLREIWSSQMRVRR